MDISNHIWSFSTVGGVKRVNLESGADLLHLKSLDQKLWTALACPVNGLEIDPKTLQLVDKDNDGQIRVPEVLEAVEWALSIIKNPDDLLNEGGKLPLESINRGHEAGRKLYASAKTILRNLGKADEEYLSVDDTSDVEKIFANTGVNGDGVITEDSSSDQEDKELLKVVMDCVGSEKDRNGKEGINEELLNKFITACKEYKLWYDLLNDQINFLGADTPAAYDSYHQVRAKVDDYFIRVRMAGYDATSAGLLNVLPAQVESITHKDFSVSLDEIASYPLSKIEAARALNLIAEINPAWIQAIFVFKNSVTDKMFGSVTSISEKQWNEIKEKFVPYQNWLSQKQGKEVEKLGIDKVVQILSGHGTQKLAKLIEEDKALSEEATNIILVDQLTRYYRDLYKLLKNFVTFYDFYTGGYAVFQAGILYIDQRSCRLCIKVTDMAKHNAMANYSGMFLIYCDCTSKATNQKMTIVAALTNGDVDNLVIGRNAIFYDRNGLDWEATVVKIIDNPISIKQAFWSPYRKVSRFIEAQATKIAAAQDNKVTSDISKGIENNATKKEATNTAAPPFDVGKFVGIFAAIGLALGAIGTAVASVVASFMGLVWWKMPIAVLGILLLISGPAMIMAYLKLRKRNLAPLLDANGWAINASAVINIHFGNMLTHTAELPKGAKVNLKDPLTGKKRPLLPIIIGIIIIIIAAMYLLNKYGISAVNF